jgi:peptide/nickel transport system permease protein
LVKGIFLVVTCFVLAANFVADCLYRRLDPRIREN